MARASTRTAFAAAAKAFVGTTTALGDKVDAPPQLVTVAANDPDERVMLWSLDMGQHDPPRAQAVVLFGQCRQIGPVLEGKTLTESQLIGLFNTLGINCACTTD